MSEPKPSTAAVGAIAADPHDHVATRFSTELRGLLTLADGKPVSLGAVLDALKDRGDALFLLVINIPFIVPMPAFGLSTPVGIIVILMSWCILRERPLWLPARMRKLEIGPATLLKIVNAALWFTGKIERVTKPRLEMMFWPGMLHLIALELAITGFSLALPLPIPGTNFIFAIIIIPLALGLLERDGLMVLLAHVIALIETVIAVALCVAIWYYGWSYVRGFIPAWHLGTA
jgi:hypothetical protein